MPNDNKGFGSDDGSFSEKIEKKEKDSKKGGDFSEKMLKNINKSISEDKRKDLKENVTKQHPHDKQHQNKQSHEKQPHQQQQNKVHEKLIQQHETHEKQSHEKQPHENKNHEPAKHLQESKNQPQEAKNSGLDSNVEPINPFEQSPVSPFSNSSLPAPDHDVRYKNQIKPQEKKPEELNKASIKDESAEDLEDQEPINPFESEPPPLPPIENKILDAKPLDRRNDGVDVHKERFESEKKESSPEEKGEAKEAVGVSNESLIRPKSEEDIVEAEVVEKEDEKIGGHVEVAKPAEAVIEKSKKNEFQEEFWSILEQAGITKKTILYILIFLIIAIIGFWFFFTQGGEDSTQPVEVKTESQPEEIPIENPSNAFSIVSSYIFGLEYATPVTPIEVVTIGEEGNIGTINAALIFGTISEPFKSDFIYYIDVIRRMDAMYHTDIYALLDIAVDRRAALNLHIEELKALIDEAKNANEKVINTLDNFDKKFEIVAAERDLYEEQFFNAADELLGKTSYENLQIFIDATKRSVEIKAYYNAYKIIAGKYALYLQFMEPRYQDILANTEALIKGIRVFDIPSSDIDAIIDLEPK